MELSIIIPYKNRAQLLRRMLNSISPTDAMEVELIMVDNGSTDSSTQMVEEFAQQTNAQYKNFHVITTACTRPGASAARNAGLSIAKGEWIYFFDSDDEIDAQFLTDIHRLIAENPDKDLIALQTNMVFADHTEKPRAITFGSSPTDHILSAQLSTVSMVLKHEFIARIGGWNEQLTTWDDWELGIRVLLNRPRIVWARAKAYHRIFIHPDSITGKDFSSTYANIKPALDAASQLIKAHGSERDIHALAYRIGILAGMLQREGSKALAHDAQQRANAILQENCSSNFFGNISRRFILNALRIYTAHHGRGAWRIALALS